MRLLEASGVMTHAANACRGQTHTLKRKPGGATHTCRGATGNLRGLGQQKCMYFVRAFGIAQTLSQRVYLGVGPTWDHHVPSKSKDFNRDGSSLVSGRHLCVLT